MVRYKRPIALATVIVMLATGCGLSPAAQPALTPQPTSAGGSSVTKTMLVAHRGGAGLAPENTLAAFERGIAEKADAVEMDVHLSKDGAVIISHDAILGRTTDKTGVIADLTLAELKTFNAAAKFQGGATAAQQVPTLDEVVKLVNGRVGMQVEIKVMAGGSRYPGIEQKVVDILRQGNMIEKSVIISFD